MGSEEAGGGGGGVDLGGVCESDDRIDLNGGWVI